MISNYSVCSPSPPPKGIQSWGHICWNCRGFPKSCPLFRLDSESIEGVLGECGQLCKNNGLMTPSPSLWETKGLGSAEVKTVAQGAEVKDIHSGMTQALSPVFPSKLSNLMFQRLWAKKQREAQGTQVGVPPHQSLTICKPEASTLWEIGWRVLRKLKTQLPCYPAVTPLGIYSDKAIVQKDACPPSS